MSPRGIAILLGAGPNVGAGIARILASPSHGNLAVALLARNPESLTSLTESLRESSGGGILHSFPSDTEPENLRKTFQKIKVHDAFRGLKLEVAIYNIKHAHKTSFLEETSERFSQSLQTYVTGAMTFGQEAARWMLSQDASSPDTSAQLQKKGTIIFTGTLGSLRTNSGYAAYGAGRSGVRMLAQSMAREFSAHGIHIVHTIINGAVKDAATGTGAKEDDEEDQKKFAKGERIRAESVGKNYLWLMEQEVDCWVHELDLRPAAEKF